MRFPVKRTLAAVAAPLLVAGGVLTFSAGSAHAEPNCTPMNAALRAAEAAEQTGDDWVGAQEMAMDEGDYSLASYCYAEAGIAFALADRLYVESGC